MDVLSPLAQSDGRVRPLTPRPRSLAGLRIGVLDNSKPNADVLLGAVAELLAKRCGAADVRRWTKPGSAMPCAQIEEVVAGADVLLTGSAD